MDYEPIPPPWARDYGTGEELDRFREYKQRLMIEQINKQRELFKKVLKEIKIKVNNNNAFFGQAGR